MFRGDELGWVRLGGFGSVKQFVFVVMRVRTRVPSGFGQRDGQRAPVQVSEP
jgi:hypothetical protein